MPAVSAINPLRVAIDNVLGALAPPVEFYLGVAPRSKPLPYVVVGLETENEDAARIGQSGHDQTIQLGCWAEDAWEAEVLYGRVKAALHGVMLTVSGHRNTRSEMERIAGFLDQGLSPDALGPYCVVGRLNTRNMVTA